MPNAVIAHSPTGAFDVAALRQKAAQLPDMTGQDLVPLVTAKDAYEWDETPWELGRGYGRRSEAKAHVVAIDYGVKRNILRLLGQCRLPGHRRASHRERR